MKKKDTLYAKLAFFLSLGFWIPLFNVGLSIGAIILASIALKRRVKSPEKFGGLGFAVAALVLSVTALILTAIGLFIYLSSESICSSTICTNINVTS